MNNFVKTIFISLGIASFLVGLMAAFIAIKNGFQESREGYPEIEILDGLHQCQVDSDCGIHARCYHSSNNETICICEEGYIRTGKSTTCNYKQRDKLVAFLLSLFVGALGMDWFYLARTSEGYIVAGVFKLITCGGCGIWWLVDWIRILADGFPDGNGEELKPW